MCGFKAALQAFYEKLIKNVTYISGETTVQNPLENNFPEEKTWKYTTLAKPQKISGFSKMAVEPALSSV